jgi:pimeloyl-ACP methyl ester carboxylesterase
MRLWAFRHSPLGFGLLANQLDAQQTRAWVAPSLEHDAIRADAVRFLRAARPQELLDVSTRLNAFDGPVVLVWGVADRAFKPELGRRLVHAFSRGRFVEVPGAHTFVPLDAPARLADEIVAIGASSPTPEKEK